MTPTRREAAEARWSAGDAARASGRPHEAFEHYTIAHDLVTDDAALHRRAHERLLVVDRALGRTRDAAVDRLLLALAPVGVFHALAVYFRLTTDHDALPR